MSLKIGKRQLAIFFIFVMLIIPTYCAVEFSASLPILSVLRVAVLVFLIFIIASKKRLNRLVSVGRRSDSLGYFALYLIVAFLCGLINKEFAPKEWMGYVFDELLIFLVLLYISTSILSVNELIRVVRKLTVFLCILGVVEYFHGSSLFSWMDTTSRGLWTGNYIRGDSYRIMGPYSHALGYDLFLIVILPLFAYDENKEEINMNVHAVSIILICLNILLSGSRSSVLIMSLELIVLLHISKRRNKHLTIIITALLVLLFILFNSVYINNSFLQYILRVFYSGVDSVFGTSFSEAYGVTSQYNEGTLSYRLLLLAAFASKQINPIWGNGFKWRSLNNLILNGTFINSVDNFYVARYIVYGLAGTLCFVLIVLYFAKLAVRNRSTPINKILLTSMIFYLIHLFVVNELGTLRFLMLIFAMIVAVNKFSVFNSTGNGVKE